MKNAELDALAASLKLIIEETGLFYSANILIWLRICLRRLVKWSALSLRH